MRRRLEKRIYIPLPGQSERLELLKLNLRVRLGNNLASPSIDPLPTPTRMMNHFLIIMGRLSSCRILWILTLFRPSLMATAVMILPTYAVTLL